MNDDIIKQISDHKTNLRKDKLHQNWDHKTNTRTYWNKLNSLNNKKHQNKQTRSSTSPTNQLEHPKKKPVNNQFVNTVKHATKRPNKKINKHTKKLPNTPMTLTAQQ